MLQVFYVDVAKVDLVLHMLQWDSPVATTRCNCWGAGAVMGHRADVGGRHTNSRRTSIGGVGDLDPCGFPRVGTESGREATWVVSRART
jgi:hypothetical protein